MKGREYGIREKEDIREKPHQIAERKRRLKKYLNPLKEENVLSIGQLIEKGFSLTMEGGSLKLYDKKEIMVLKLTLT